MDKFVIRYAEGYRQMGIEKDDDTFKPIPKDNEQRIEFTKKELWSLVNFIKKTGFIKGYKPNIVNC